MMEGTQFTQKTATASWGLLGAQTQGVADREVGLGHWEPMLGLGRCRRVT